MNFDSDSNRNNYITSAYHSWRGEKVDHPSFLGGYQDIPGFCKSTQLKEVQEHGYVLTPGRYVGSEEIEEEEGSFHEKMLELTKTLADQMAQSQKMDNEIRKQLARIEYDF